MDHYFRNALEALKQTADGLIAANEGIKKLADAVLTAKNEHEDLRETVSRLEHLVMEQGVRTVEQSAEIRALRADVQALRKAQNGGA